MEALLWACMLGIVLIGFRLVYFSTDVKVYGDTTNEENKNE